MFVCSRCGAQIQYPATIGGVIFGSECVQKIDSAEWQRLFGVDCSLAEAVKQWTVRRLRSKAKGINKGISIDFERIPKVGDKLRIGSSPFYGVVQSYTKDGVKVYYQTNKQSWVATEPFDRAMKLEVLSQ